MKIGYDAKRIVRNHTGLGSYSRTLVNAIANLDSTDTLLLYAPDGGDATLSRQIEPRPNIQFVYPSPPLPLGGKLGMAARWREKTIVRQLQADGIDLYHGLSGELPSGLKQAGIPAIVTIHDLIFLRHPEYYHWWDVMRYRQKFYRTLKEADRIIAISECTKRDILHYGDFPEDRIDVIYQSCSTRFAHPADEHISQRVHAEYDLPAHYILSVGTIEERKNILLAVKALWHLPEHLSLVVIGRPTKYLDTIRRYIAQHPRAPQGTLQRRIRFLHDVPNEDLPAIYQMAEAFVYPSRYEGFGIPIIEAIQSGLPVVAAKGSCLEEAGGPESLYIDPDDDRALAKALLTAIDERDSRVAASQQYVRRFENNNVARQVTEVYREIMKK